VRVPSHVAAIVVLALAALPGCRTTSPQAPAWGFGVTLGGVFDKGTGQPIDAFIAGRALYRIRPPQPHRAVSEYAVITERDSGVVLGVVGWDRYSDGAACQRERDTLAPALERRYGPGHPADSTEKERMRGLPETLAAADLTLYRGLEGVVAMGCAGQHLLVAFWFPRPEAAPAQPAPGR